MIIYVDENLPLQIPEGLKKIYRLIFDETRVVREKVCNKFVTESRF